MCIGDAKIIEEFFVEVSTLGGVRRVPPALITSIDDVCRGPKATRDACSDVCRIRGEVTSHDIMHAWLWTLGCHVEPKRRGEYGESILMDEVWVLEESHLRIISSFIENVGEPTVIVVPCKLEWASCIVLFVRLIGPVVVRPTKVVIVAACIAQVATRAVHILNEVQTLPPEWGLGAVVDFPLRVIAGLEGEVSEHRRQLFLAHVDSRPVNGVCVFTAEGGELADGIQEAIICVYVVLEREEEVPLCFREDALDSLHVCFLQIVGDWSIQSHWCCDSSVGRSVVRVRNPVGNSNLVLVVVPVLIRPKAVLLDASLD